MRKATFYTLVIGCALGIIISALLPSIPRVAASGAELVSFGLIKGDPRAEDIESWVAKIDPARDERDSVVTVYRWKWRGHQVEVFLDPQIKRLLGTRDWREVEWRVDEMPARRYVPFGIDQDIKTASPAFQEAVRQAYARITGAPGGS